MIYMTGRESKILVPGMWSGGEVKSNDFPAFGSGDFYLETRITNSHEMMHLLLLGDHFQARPSCNVKSITIGYFPYGRADREMNREPNGCRASAKLIRNAFPHTHIEVIDAHNPRVLECFGIYNRYPYFWNTVPATEATVVAPDAGSAERAHKFYSRFSATNASNFIQCSKSRDSNRNPVTVLPEDEIKDRCVIVDDIIDGGRTFIDLASKLRRKGAKRVDLVVTHGIFSNGFNIPDIDNIYTTNTFLNLSTKNDFSVDTSAVPANIKVYKEIG